MFTIAGAEKADAAASAFAYSGEGKISHIFLKQGYDIVSSFFGYGVIFVGSGKPNTVAIIIGDGEDLIIEDDGDILVKRTPALAWRVFCRRQIFLHLACFFFGEYVTSFRNFRTALPSYLMVMRLHPVKESMERRTNTMAKSRFI